MISPEQQMSRFTIKRSESRIEIKDAKDPHVYLRAEFDAHKRAWNLLDVSVVDQNKGTGKALVSALVQQLGPKQSVYAYVVEPRTKKAILREGWGQQAKDHPLTVTDPDQLHALKFVRLVNGGGMQTLNCVISWEHFLTIGYTQEDVDAMKQSVLRSEVDGDRVLTVYWHGVTP